MSQIQSLFDALSFLADPWVVVIWYTLSIGAAALVIWDSLHANSSLNAPLKVVWPIIVFFFSIAGLALYAITSRPRDIGSYPAGKPKMLRFTDYSRPHWRKVIASATHCVGGDGLGIVTAMILARLLHFRFWAEFWFEYLVGYLLGWLIFQTWAMRLQGNGWLMAIWKGGRAEFFSMITVMLGMGLVMRFVTPAAFMPQPPPYLPGFWTFAALGLMVGFVFTYPVNSWLVSIGWKHGQGRDFDLQKMARSSSCAQLNPSSGESVRARS